MLSDTASYKCDACVVYHNSPKLRSFRSFKKLSDIGPDTGQNIATILLDTIFHVVPLILSSN